MGDIPVNPASNETDLGDTITQSMAHDDGGPPALSGKNAAAEPATSSLRQQQPPSTQHAFSAQFDMTSPPPPQGRQGPYNMGQLANALPHGNYAQGHYSQAPQQRHNPSSSPPTMSQMQQMQQMQHMSQYGLPHMQMGASGYYMQQPHMGQYYNPGQMPQTQGQAAMPAGRNMAYYAPPMMMNPPQSAYYYPSTNNYPSQSPTGHNAMGPGPYMSPNATSPDLRIPSHSPDAAAAPYQPKHVQVPDGPGERSNAVRGPPRKPRQSGHAIWIGNLPPQTDLMSLVHHVCKETTGLESLFLISKSNCAFANFNDEQTSTTAQQKLHDSKFQSVRLVSRLRKNTVEGAAGVNAPTGPATDTATTPTSIEPEQDNTPSETESSSPAVDQTTQENLDPLVDGVSQQDKFFILKSLTAEDLELSVRTGIWATQSHNEEPLNKAFKNADNVYLVFSANKSGEYFGYARMLSQINEDPAAAIEFAPKAQATTDTDLPKAIPTDATEYAPKGRIIDDSARGTIFWEAEREESEDNSEDETEDPKSPTGEEEDKTWGKPFKLEWLSTNRLPFYRTRGLRNPWNSNREVKIARDGTELEPGTGRRLIGLFNRVQSPNSMPAAMRHNNMGMISGYPQGRPYGQ